MFGITIVIYTMITEKIPKCLPQKTEKFNSHKYFHGNSHFAALCCEVVFFTYSEKLIGSLSKNGQGNSMSKNPKRAEKFIHLFFGGNYIIVGLRTTAAIIYMEKIQIYNVS